MQRNAFLALSSAGNGISATDENRSNDTGRENRACREPSTGRNYHEQHRESFASGGGSVGRPSANGGKACSRPLSVVAALLVCCLGSMATPAAQAVPISTTLRLVDSGPNASLISIDLGVLGGSITSNITTFLSGEFNVTLDNVGVQALALSIDSGTIALSDTAVNISAGILGGVAGELTGAALSLAGTPHPQLPHSSGANSFFDLAGDTISLDSGLLTYEGTGAVGGALGSGTIDLAGDPLALELPSGATVRIIETAISPTANHVTLVVPIHIPTTTITTDPVDISASLTALLLATGMKVIPEPGAGVLLGLGVAGFLAVAYRRRRSP